MGTGLSLRYYDTNTYVVGVDLSAQMLVRAARKVARWGLGSVSLCRMDACRLAFADASFDVVFSAFVASVVPDRRAYFAELKRVCRPGGLICIVNHVRFRNRALGWLEERLQPLTRRLGWHTDLTLEEIVEGLRPGEVSVHTLRPLDPWPIVICRRPGPR